ncbi:C-GCAxxG-C-C family protein [uncultured Flavonifractor sp.]|uniref:C-GCAxxG-C-C family protein n=1 Tax=uncultured Flavonifractor sp. TaxID=1193534 RepID=UPI002632ADA5|nr:C-GCAxxG-C-C family protein [uncultured Flavonifractor sp.]
MNRLEQTQALRARTDVHYNCCQSVLIPFCQAYGLSEEEAYRLGAHFGSGMRHGATCGAVTGALMALGLAGRDEAAAQELLRCFREKHGELTCDGLLEWLHGEEEGRKPFCDRLVLDAVSLVEALLAE